MYFVSGTCHVGGGETAWILNSILTRRRDLDIQGHTHRIRDFNIQGHTHPHKKLRCPGSYSPTEKTKISRVILTRRKNLDIQVPQKKT